MASSLTRKHYTRSTVLLVIWHLFPATPVHAQTLLETWVFIGNFGWIDIDQIKELPDGRIRSPYHPNINRGGEEYWSVKNAEECVLRSEVPSLGVWREFYLNNVLPDYKARYKDRQSIQIPLRGEQPIICWSARGDEGCSQELKINAINYDDWLRLDRAVKYIFANFCKHAQHSRPF